MTSKEIKEKFNSIIDDAITNEVNLVVTNGCIAEKDIKMLSALYSIKCHTKSFETQQIQANIAEQMDDAIKKVDLSNLDLDKMKDIVKSIM